MAAVRIRARPAVLRPEPRQCVDYLALMADIRQQYLADNRPWVICYSGGKDSTTLLQMVFYALEELPRRQLRKPIHVLTNDTLVENPVIDEYVKGQVKAIEVAGKSGLFKHNPNLFSVATVTPTLDESFWVCLIGKGYPSPNRWFRWCTERLKINPTSRYIEETVGRHGSTIIVLGTRKSESANRSAAMSNHDNGGKLRKHDLTNAHVYAPIADLSNNEVWAYLLQSPSPWGSNNRSLLNLYGNACKGGECPFVIETGTQSCGKSRFGCWVCTVVDKDQAMESYVNNGHAHLKPLLDYRNRLYDIRQQSVQSVPRRLTPGTRFSAFLLRTRRQLLESLLTIQAGTGTELISDAEVARVRGLLDSESAGATGNGLRYYTYRLPGRAVARVLSDYDIQQTPRQRLGPFHLAKAKLLDCESAHGVKSASRVMYKVHEKPGSTRPGKPARTRPSHRGAVKLQEASHVTN